jgi:hypothetical protein
MRAAPAPRIVFEQFGGATRAQEAAEQRQQVGHARAAAPEHRPGRGGALEHVDEEQRLAGLVGRWGAPQRHRNIGADVGQQAPEQRMGEVVQTAQTQQLLGLEQLDAEGPVAHEIGRQPA